MATDLGRWHNGITFYPKGRSHTPLCLINAAPPNFANLHLPPGLRHTTMATMNLEVTDVRNEQDDAFISAQLSAYNAAFAQRDFKPLRVYARESDGSVIGGLLADTYWEYLDVHKLWIGETYRNAGHATRLLLAAENEARRRGCKHAFLDTFSFQALDFYRKLGYREFGRLEGFSGKHERHYLHKRLGDAAA